MKLNDAERMLLIRFLKSYSERLSNDGCNDFELPNTPENVVIVKEAYEIGMGKEDANMWTARLDEESGETICVINWMLVDYLAHKLQEEDHE